MKIHSSVLSANNVYNAAWKVPGVFVDSLRQVGSRSRTRGFVLKLESDGTPDQHGNRRNRRVNAGTSQTVDQFDRPLAASWADWGHVLGYLYAIDPDMVTPYYADRADFDRKTGGRFVYSLDGGATAPVLTATSEARLRESSVNLSPFELEQHGW